ncbi:Os11g0305300 [Oryza sativa Japonica Group]|uniref:Os11g0305300 protein n=1 Tax=Oryza sativa subsp. japonica TaxID=39947 RepID=A0A0P0Y1B2_ORYSJ|nr:hypothetical protein EE612_054971 [Oryza sativa]BAT13704.1 Os11g0305300 [Oryza sativa Japonica Group]
MLMQLNLSYQCSTIQLLIIDTYNLEFSTDQYKNLNCKSHLLHLTLCIHYILTRNMESFKLLSDICFLSLMI